MIPLTFKPLKRSATSGKHKCSNSENFNYPTRGSFVVVILAVLHHFNIHQQDKNVSVWLYCTTLIVINKRKTCVWLCCTTLTVINRRKTQGCLGYYSTLTFSNEREKQEGVAEGENETSTGEQILTSVSDKGCVCHYAVRVRYVHVGSFRLPCFSAQFGSGTTTTS